MAQAARCSARAPKIALACATLAAAAASATLLIQAAALALGSLSGTGRSRRGACTADRPVGCDARCRSYVSYALDQAARRVSLQRPTCDCSACMSSLRLMRVCGLRWSPCRAPVGCDARRCNCVGYALDQRCKARVLAVARCRRCVGNALDSSCCSCSRIPEQHRPLAACMSSLRLMHVCGLR